MSTSRKLVAGAVLVAAALLTAACGGGSSDSGVAAGDNPREAGSGTGEIKVWAHQGEAGEVTALQQAVDSFNSSQSDVKVTLQLIPSNDYTKTVQATSADQLPDVLEYDGPLMSSFVYDGKLAPVDGLVSPGDSRTTRRRRSSRRTPTRATASCTGCRCTTPVWASTATRSCSTRPA